jgi:hypothetical protein
VESDQPAVLALHDLEVGALFGERATGSLRTVNIETGEEAPLVPGDGHDDLVDGREAGAFTGGVFSRVRSVRG